MFERQKINAMLKESGIYEGEPFNNPEEVREYFTVENFEKMFPGETIRESELDKMAEFVIENQIHFSKLSDLEQDLHEIQNEIGNQYVETVENAGDKRQIICLRKSFIPARFLELLADFGWKVTGISCEQPYGWQKVHVEPQK